MKKIFFIFVSILLIFLLVVVLGVTTGWFGLFHTNTDGNNMNHSFIGTWETNHSWYENGTKIDEWTYDLTFYANGSSKFESDNHSQISWEPYVFKNNQICYEDQGNEICYSIEYLDSGDRMLLTATIATQYGEVVVIRDCKRK